MYTILTTTWDWKPSVIIGCVIFSIYYYIIARKFKAGFFQIVLFNSGTLILFLSLVSPVDVVGDVYLFSVHMFQHLLLLLIVPPLWLWGIPVKALKRIRARAPIINRLEHGFTNPFVAFAIGIGTVWLWHIPLLYDAALRDENLHALEHMTFIVSGVIFWWTVMIEPDANFKRISPWGSILYLFAAAAASSVLGIILAYAAPGLYPNYIHPVDRYNILSIIRDGWGFGLADDQQTGGLMMWVLGSPLYLVGCLGALGRWYRQSELETAREIAAELEAERAARANLSRSSSNMEYNNEMLNKSEIRQDAEAVELTELDPNVQQARRLTSAALAPVEENA